MKDLTIEPLARPFHVTMAPPGSKSLTNRALVLSALAGGKSEISNVLLADDTAVMLQSLGELGFAVAVDRDRRTVVIEGCGGRIPAKSVALFCGNSGTTIRFLTALCCLGKGVYSLDGIERMRQRPIGQLITMLAHLGVRISCTMADGFPPVRINADGLPGGMLRFIAGQSSQFLSAVLQISPYARNEVRVDLEGNQTSWPYVAMTMRLMDVFGHTPHLIRDASERPRQIIIPRGEYAATRYAVEPDASNATYFLAAAALHPGSSLTINGLGTHSLQGDVRFADVLRQMGAAVEIGPESITVHGTDELNGVNVDLLDMPDTAQTLAVTALFAGGPTVLRGLHTLRHKETDRLAALAAELTKLGAVVVVSGDMLTIEPPKQIRAAAIDTYDDHRMAMSFALAGTKAAGVTIRDSKCVNKTYPGFFADLQMLRG